MRKCSKPKSLILARWADQIQALDTRKRGSRTGPWPNCWTRDITVGWVLGSRMKEVAVSLSLVIAFRTRESRSWLRDNICSR